MMNNLLSSFMNKNKSRAILKTRYIFLHHDELELKGSRVVLRVDLAELSSLNMQHIWRWLSGYQTASRIPSVWSLWQKAVLAAVIDRWRVQADDLQKQSTAAIPMWMLGIPTASPFHLVRAELRPCTSNYFRAHYSSFIRLGSTHAIPLIFIIN